MLNYQVKGDSNKAIIFIHGNSSSLESWDAVVSNSLLTDYKLIRIDLPGHGKSFRSAEPEKDYTLYGLAAHVTNFIKQLNLTEYILVGSSLGSNIIGESITSLSNCKGVFISGSCLLGKGLSLQDIFLPNPNSAASFIAEPTNEQVDLLVEDAVYNASAKVMQNIKQVYLNTDPNFRLYIASSTIPGNYTDELQNIHDTKIPTAFVFGKEEKLCNTHYLDNIDMPKWKNKVFLIENSGHFSQLDQPQALTILIKEFAEDCFR